MNRFARVIFPVLALGAALAGASEPAVQIPRSPGVLIGSVISDGIDYENFVVVDQADAEGFGSVTRWTVPDANAPNGRREFSARMLTRAADAATARRLITVHQGGDPETFPGATTGSWSQQVYRELKAAGEAAVVIGAARNTGKDLMASLMTARKYYRGVLKRVEAQTIPVPVLLDGQRTTLPALHVKGDVAVGSESGTAEFWILDDERWPLTLKWTVLGATAQIVRIDRPVGRAALGEGKLGGIDIGKGLAGASCRAELHGVYFNTGSATLLPESTGALRQAADLLKGHSDWRVQIEGHTDGIGSKESNQALSQRRAESVRDALTKQFGVGSAQVEARGFGAEKPIETNATVEGRAHNRRVELSRSCP